MRLDCLTSGAACCFTVHARCAQDASHKVQEAGHATKDAAIDFKDNVRCNLAAFILRCCGCWPCAPTSHLLSLAQHLSNL